MSDPKQKKEVLKINSFGLSPRARYAAEDRTHRAVQQKNVSAVELYNSIRGATLAASLAAQDNKDCAVALRQIQRLACELTKRLLPPENIHIQIEGEPD